MTEAPFFRIHQQVGPPSLVCPQNSLNPTTGVRTWPHLPAEVESGSSLLLPLPPLSSSLGEHLVLPSTTKAAPLGLSASQLPPHHTWPPPHNSQKSTLELLQIHPS